MNFASAIKTWKFRKNNLLVNILAKTLKISSSNLNWEVTVGIVGLPLCGWGRGREVKGEVWAWGELQGYLSRGFLTSYDWHLDNSSLLTVFLGIVGSFCWWFSYWLWQPKMSPSNIKYMRTSHPLDSSYWLIERFSANFWLTCVCLLSVSGTDALERGWQYIYGVHLTIAHSCE